jgi:uncharacterized protein
MILELEPVFNNIGFEKSFDYELMPEDFEINGINPFLKPVTVKGSVRNSAGVVEIRAEAVAQMQLFCDRCATEILQKLTVPVNHVLVTKLNDEDNDDFLVVGDMRFNLDPLVREDLLLELPTKVLCKDNCKGICPQCGKNLNDGPCSCEKPIDPRLEALRQLLDNN